jgi:hypothetical protein
MANPHLRSARVSLLKLGIITIVFHQFVSSALFVVEAPRGEASLPPDFFNYVLRVLAWPFALVPTPTPAHPVSPPDWLLLTAWLLGSVFWACAVCGVALLLRRKSAHSHTIANT